MLIGSLLTVNFTRTNFQKKNYFGQSTYNLTIQTINKQIYL